LLVSEHLATPGPPMIKSGSLKLLAIDDDPQTLSLISDALAHEGFEILTASDSESGFESFLRYRPRIILLDLLLPGVSGMELLERMIRVDPGANVILVSGHYSAESAVEAIQKGACDYLTKPFDVNRLRARVASFVAEFELRSRTLTLDQELLEACQF